MQSDNIYLNEEAKKKLIAGVSKVASAVKVTLGAAGSNAVLEHALYPYHITTNDGVSIAAAVELSDPVERIGANIIKEVATRADKESGDGTTTATVLTEAILLEGLKVEGASPMEVKRSLDACYPIIEASLEAQKKEITVDEVGAVASISAESEEIGGLIQEIYQKIGKEGIIELDNSGTFETRYSISPGVRLRNCGYISASMANEGTKAILKKPKILIVSQKISSIADLNPLWEKMLKANNPVREVVLFCDEIEPEVARLLLLPQNKQILNTIIIKAPRLWKDWLFEDFAAMTGATIVQPATGINFKNVGLEHLGTCDKIVIGKDETTVIGIKDLTSHIEKIKEDKSEEALLRVSWLNTQSATIFLGANSEVELSYKRLKTEDAKNAAYLALKGGVVAGGGIALLDISKGLPENIGGTILKEALRAPLIQIMKNAGMLPLFDDFFENIDKTVMGGRMGFDAKTGEIVDMFAAGIVDPCIVTKNAIKNAISVAGTILTARVVIPLPKKEEVKQNPL